MSGLLRRGIGFYKDSRLKTKLFIIFGFSSLLPILMFWGISTKVNENALTEKVNQMMTENLTQIAAGLDVFPPKSGQVFDNNAVHCSVFDIGHHFLKGRPVEQNTAVAVVHSFCH